MIKDFGFIIPQNCQFGVGALKKLPDFLKAAGSDNVMLISDRGLEAIGVVEKVRKIIKDADLKYAEYLDVLPNPTTTIVDECAAKYKEAGCTALIALGGGSPMDTSKAIGIIILGWGIVQVGMSIQSHDASQRTQGFLCLFGGLMIAFAKEILSAIGAV